GRENCSEDNPPAHGFIYVAIIHGPPPDKNQSPAHEMEPGLWNYFDRETESELDQRPTDRLSQEITHAAVRPPRTRRRRSHVRFGSKADICRAKRYVRFTPESGHSGVWLEYPLCAKTRR